jgi:hypothetical protein
MSLTRISIVRTTDLPSTDHDSVSGECAPTRPTRNPPLLSERKNDLGGIAAWMASSSSAKGDRGSGASMSPEQPGMRRRVDTKARAPFGNTLPDAAGPDKGIFLVSSSNSSYHAKLFKNNAIVTHE